MVVLLTAAAEPELAVRQTVHVLIRCDPTQHVIELELPQRPRSQMHARARAKIGTEGGVGAGAKRTVRVSAHTRFMQTPDEHTDMVHNAYFAQSGRCRSLRCDGCNAARCGDVAMHGDTTTQTTTTVFQRVSSGALMIISILIGCAYLKQIRARLPNVNCSACGLCLVCSHARTHTHTLAKTHSD